MPKIKYRNNIFANANMPFDVQAEILKRVVGVKSLLRFRAVSKQWKSFIDSSEFITHHTVNQVHPNHLLLEYYNTEDCEYYYVSVVDDQSFPRHKFVHTVSPNLELSTTTFMHGCSHGLVCFYFFNLRIEVVFFWNPSIRKFVSVMLPPHESVVAVGSGVCSKTIDPKVVKITDDFRAEIFTLGNGAWRSIPMNLSMPFQSTEFHKTFGLVIDGVVYWIAYNKDSGRMEYKNAHIISFDLTSEEFGQLALPDGLPEPVIYKFKKSLILLRTTQSYQVWDAWMMTKINDLKTASFTKLFKLDCNEIGCSLPCKFWTVGFRSNGELIIRQRYNGYRTLKSYDPCSKHIRNVVGLKPYFEMTSYTESLLLHNHPASVTSDIQ